MIISKADLASEDRLKKGITYRESGRYRDAVAVFSQIIHDHLVPMIHWKAAHRFLGDSYRDGKGVKRNLKTAASHYHNIAILGDAYAIREIAKLLGQAGLARESNTWIHTAAELGDRESQKILARSLANIRNPSGDTVAALKWQTIADGCPENPTGPMARLAKKIDLKSKVNRAYREAHAWQSKPLTQDRAIELAALRISAVIQPRYG